MTGCPVVSYPPARARSGPRGLLSSSLAHKRKNTSHSLTRPDSSKPSLTDARRLIPPARARSGPGPSLPTLQLILEQICAQIGLGVRDAELGGPAVRGGQQPADPACHGVLGELGIMQLTEFLKAGLLVLDPQHTGSTQMIGYVVAKNLQSSLD